MFELRLVPEAADVSSIRRLLEDTVRRVWQDSDAISRVAIAAHELLENAAKYSNGGHTTLRVALERLDGHSAVSVTLSNATTPEHIERIQAILDEMRSSDPAAFYQSLMRRNAQHRKVSSLGLARIRAECEMHLSFDIENDRVSITARSELPPRSAV